MLRVFFVLVLMQVVSVGVSSAFASEKMLNDFFSDVQSLRANFEQVVVDETGQTLERSSGTFYLSRPGKFRWDYRNPDPEFDLGQQIIADGTSIYMFDPDLEQVTQRSMQDALSQVPSLLLVQFGEDIKQHFQVADFGLTDGLSWVGLKPTDEDAAYQQLMIGFLNGQLHRITLLDGLGNETRLQLSQVQNNLKLSANRFNFVAPEGVDVLIE